MRVVRKRDLGAARRVSGEDGFSAAQVEADTSAAAEKTYHGIAARLDRLPDGSWQNRLSILLGCVIFCGGLEQYMGSGLLALWLDIGWSTPEMNTSCVVVTMLGYLVGSIATGFLSDLTGRRKGILLAVAVTAISSFIASLAPTMELMIAIRFVMGIGMGGCILGTYCVLAEYTPPRSRGRYAAETGLVGSISFPVAVLCTMGSLSWVTWRILCVVGAVVCAAVFVMVYLRFPESPRWLASCGRNDEADSITCRAEKTFLSRGIKLERVDMDEVVCSAAKAMGPAPAARMLTRPVVVKHMVVLSAALFAMNLLVYSITTWTPTVFLTSGMTSALSLGVTFVISLGAPFGIFALMLLSDKHGRKTGLVSGLLVLSVASYLWSVMPVDNAVLMMLYGFILCSVLYYYSLLACSVYIGEQFPTRIRARGAGIANAIGRIASVTAPSLTFPVIGFSGISGVYVVSGAVCLMTALLVAVLGDETRYRALEDINGYGL